MYIQAQVIKMVFQALANSIDPQFSYIPRIEPFYLRWTEDLKKMGSPEKAGDLFKERTLKSGLAEDWVALGLWHAEADKNLKKAIECLTEATTIDPTFGPAWYYQSKYYFQLEDFPQALTCCQKTSMTYPTLPNAWYNLGTFTLRETTTKQNFEFARRYFKKAVNVDPYFAPAWESLGICYLKAEATIENQRASLGSFLSAIFLAPRLVNSWINLGTLLIKGIGIKPNPWLGFICYKKALELNPDNKATLENIGACYQLGIGTPDDAEKAAQYFALAEKKEQLMNDLSHPGKDVPIMETREKKPLLSLYENHKETLPPTFQESATRKEVLLPEHSHITHGKATLKEEHSCFPGLSH